WRMSSNRWWSSRCSTFDREPVKKLSRQTTSCPSFKSRSHRCEPTNPEPPVTSIRRRDIAFSYPNRWPTSKASPVAPADARVYHRRMSGAGEERRGAARIPIEMWVEETTGSERYYRRAGNLSRGGLRLEHTIPLPVGTSVNLTFTLPGDDVPVS